MTNDISSRTDIEAIVASFYKRLIDDPAIGFYFTDITAIKLDSHLPKIVAFWETQLFKRPVYRGNFFEAHKHIHLKAALLKDHFDWWLVLFNKAIDQHAAGPTAEKMKARATLIATSMERALTHNESPTGLIGLGIYTPT